jgi:hypothetical protein
MQHEKIFKDSTRGKIKIRVSIYVETFLDKYNYTAVVSHTPPGKRKELHNNSIATPEEIQAAKMELWNKLKP